MENHPNLAKNSLQGGPRGKEKKQKLWAKLTGLLNSNGPPTKTTTAWQKVWTDYKYNSKRKLANNKKSLRKTGGGPYEGASISSLEDRVIAVAAIEAQVAGVPNVRRFGADNNSTSSDSDSSKENHPPNKSPLPSHSQDKDIEEILAKLEAETRETNKTVTDSSCDNTSETRCPNTSKSTNILENTSIPKKKTGVKLSLFNEDIQNHKEFHETLLNVLKERNKLEERKIALLESQIKSDIEFRKMKIKKIELEMEKLTAEIELLNVNNKD